MTAISDVEAMVATMEPLRPDLATKLRLALHGFVYAGRSLDRGLGLRGGPGGVSPLHAARLARRNRWLQEVHRLVGSVAAVADEIARYERAPESERSREEPAPHWSPARAAIHRAAHTGVRLPHSDRGLRDALDCSSRPLPNAMDQHEHQPVTTGESE
jgi:hypothetical protein